MWRNIFVLAGVGVLAAVLLSFAVVPMLGASTPEAEEEPLMEISAEEIPYWEDYPHGSVQWPPSRDLPATGSPHLMLDELYVTPESFNKVNLVDALWIAAAINATGELVRLDAKSVEAYFAYYELANDKMPYSPNFGVTFPDGSVKYYYATYAEVP